MSKQDKQKERLMGKFDEMCKSVEGFMRELKQIAKRNKYSKTKDKEYNEWVYNEYFSDEHIYGELESYINAFLCKFGGLIYHMTNQDFTKYVDFDLVSWQPVIRFVHNEYRDCVNTMRFDTCPDCGIFVKHGCPSCVCGHKFQDDSVMTYGGMGVCDRIYKEEDGVVKHEVFIDNKRYTAIYKVEDIKDIADKEGLEIELPAIKTGLSRDNDFTSFIARKRKEFEATEPQYQLELGEPKPEDYVTWMDYIKIKTMENPGGFWYPYKRTENGIEPIMVEDEED